MTTQHVQVGDVVAWDDVPDGALVLNISPTPGYMCRINDVVGLCYMPHWASAKWMSVIPSAQVTWPWACASKGSVVIIALGLTGNETANELRSLAEAFEPAA